MLSAIPFLLFSQVITEIERLPIDEVMGRIEAAIPSLREIEAQTEEEVGQVGPAETDWAVAGLSMAAAIETDDKTPDGHALGEWTVGGNAVFTTGSRPLRAPDEFNRYEVSTYTGPIEYNYYHRVAGVPDHVVIYTFGTIDRIGNAECHKGEGIEVFSTGAWRAWSMETMLVVFGLLRAMRDDPREYCNLFRPDGHGGFLQVSYTGGGHPYVSANRGAQTFTVTSLDEARERIFVHKASNPEN